MGDFVSKRYGEILVVINFDFADNQKKFRLAKSGLKNVIYIIEDFNLGPETTSKYGEAIDSAIASTQVVNGFFVKRTAKLDDTIRYLARMTHLLKSIYEVWFLLLAILAFHLPLESS